MFQFLEPSGLSAVLDWTDGVAKDKLLAATLATSFAASPLVAGLGRFKGMPAPGRLAAAAAGPVVAYALQPSSFAASAAAPATHSDSVDTVEVVQVPRSVLSLFGAKSLSKTLIRNLGVQCLMRFNKYMAEVIQHEQDALQAEAQGLEPPPPPPFPDMRPCLKRGLVLTGRELAVATTKTVYQHIVYRNMEPHRAKALLRNNRAFARHVLAKRLASSPVRRRMAAYYFASLHSTALFYAAEFSVATMQHTYQAVDRFRKDLGPRRTRTKRAVVYWTKGVALQFARCTLSLMGAALGAALGSLVNPGTGTHYAQLATEILMSIALGHAVSALLESGAPGADAPAPQVEGGAPEAADFPAPQLQ